MKKSKKRNTPKLDLEVSGVSLSKSLLKLLASTLAINSAAIIDKAKGD